MRKLIIGLGILFFCILIPTNTIHGESVQADVLILYNVGNSDQKEEVHILDLLVGHFADTIQIESIQSFNGSTKEYTHLIYAGLSTTKDLTDSQEKIIDNFKGSVYFIGNGVETIERFHGIATDGLQTINKIQTEGLPTIPIPIGKTINRVVSHTSFQVFGKGLSKKQTYPLFLMQNNKYHKNYYLAALSTTNPTGRILGESLFEFFSMQKRSQKKYLRLEDVHPKSDIHKLKAIGRYLHNKNIPYMVVLIPVYVDPETHEETHLKEVPELVNTLQTMQKNGASIVLHGYKHQYRKMETGEGFEYWDVKYDRPVYQPKNAKVKTQEDFINEKAYQQFIQEGIAFEKQYIKETIEKGITELLEQDLYPLAFEPPHYAMSLTGYQEVAKYFSTYIGQIQISNKTYQTTYTPLYTSKPILLHGMTVIPENLGYVHPDNNNAHIEIMKKAESIDDYGDAYLSFFYHPYLGLERLKPIVEEMEEYKEIGWFDLKSNLNHVTINDITIKSKRGEVVIKQSLQSLISNIFSEFWWIVFPILILFIIVIHSIKSKR